QAGMKLLRRPFVPRTLPSSTLVVEPAAMQKVWRAYCGYQSWRRRRGPGRIRGVTLTSGNAMSLKYTAQKIGESHYVLPRVSGMKVEAHAYLSESLYEASEETLWQQIANAASYEGVIGAYLMPDAHTGFGVPVGSVV